MKIQLLGENNKKGSRNYFSYLKAVSVGLGLFAGQLSYAQTGTWAKVTTLASNENMGVMLLMTDGTVMCHNATGGSSGYGTGWDKLTPSAAGTYVNGTWTTMASMNQERTVFASQVLPNGKLFVAGGEYGVGDTAGEVYDPVANTWTRTEKVPGTQYNKTSGTPDNIYDGNSEILPNGNILVGPQIGPNPSDDALYYSPTTNTWSVAPTAPLNHDEAAWLKLPDSSILFVGIGSLNSCRFRPQTNTWITDASLPDSIYDKYGEEAGSAVMLPNGKAIFFGATGHNCIYTPTGTTAKGSWVRVADFPFVSGKETGMVDAPSAMMVNGHILMSASPIGTGTGNNEFLTPTYFFEYNYVSNSFARVTSTIPGFGGDSMTSIICQQISMLDLPDGNVLMSINQDGATSKQYYIYTPGSGPIAAGKPTINSILPDGCPYYKVTGKLFNGISEGAGYGDDWQNSTNYPLVRLTSASGNVYYCKTTNWNRIGAVQTDSLEDTAIFTPPTSLPVGTYSLAVVVNGFASNPTIFTTLQASAVSPTGIACHGGTGSATASITGGLTPYTYSWSASGGNGAIGTGLSAGTYTVTVHDANDCSATAKVVVTQPATALSVTTYSASAVGSCNGVAAVTVSGGGAPYTYSWSSGGATTDTLKGKCAGNYCCTITDNNGCVQTACVTIGGTTTGTDEISNASNISIYPDPNNGSFAIAGVTQGQTIELYNELGQRLSSVKAENPTMYFNIANQADGIYLVRILNTDGTIASQNKIVKRQ